MVLRILFALALVLASSTGADARKRQIGNMVFEPPKDWRLGGIRDEGWATLFNDRKDERCEYCYIRIHLGAPAKGSFNGWMRRQMKSALDDDARVLKTMESKTLTQRGIGEVKMRVRLIKRNGKRMQVFLGFKLEDRFEMIHFEGPMSDEDDVHDTSAAMREEFLPMLDKLRFVSKGAKPVIGKPVAGALNGVWFGSRIDTGINFDGSMRMDVNPVIYTFYPDGRFYDGVPEDGISTFDYDDAVLNATTETGNYIAKDDEIRLFYADGDRDALEREGDTFQEGNAKLWKVKIPEPGFRFEGRLSNFRYSPFAPGISGGVATSSDWRFFKDGTYTSDSFVGASGSFDGGGGFTTTSDAAEKRGRYEIADGVIRLTPPREREIVWPFFLQDLEDGLQPIVRGEYLKDE